MPQSVPWSQPPVGNPPQNTSPRKRTAPIITPTCKWGPKPSKARQSVSNSWRTEPAIPTRSQSDDAPYADPEWLYGHGIETSNYGLDEATRSRGYEVNLSTPTSGLAVPPGEYFGVRDKMQNWTQRHDPRSKEAPNFDIMKHLLYIKGLPCLVFQLSHPKAIPIESDGYLQFLVRPMQVIAIDAYTVNGPLAPKKTPGHHVVCLAWQVIVFL